MDWNNALEIQTFLDVVFAEISSSNNDDAAVKKFCCLLLFAHLKLSDEFPTPPGLYQKFFCLAAQRAWMLECSLPSTQNLITLLTEFITMVGDSTHEVKEEIISSQFILGADEALEQFFKAFAGCGRNYSSETNLVITRRTKLGRLRGTVHLSLSRFSSANELLDKLVQGMRAARRCTSSLNFELVGVTEEFPLPSMMLTMLTSKGPTELQIFLHFADFAAPFNKFMDTVNELALQGHSWLNPQKNILSMCHTLMVESGLNLTMLDQAEWITAETSQITVERIHGGGGLSLSFLMNDMQVKSIQL
jgi:hypothetical protein